ncbi:MAG: DUF6600 domain-containing protein, partial [Rubrivivax sp.]
MRPDPLIRRTLRALSSGRALVAWIALMLAVPAQAQDDPPGRVGRIGAVQGEAWVFEAEQGEWVPAQRNRPLTGGDRLSTGADGRVELGVGSTAMLLGASSELEAVQLDDERIELQLHRGQFAVNIRSREVAGEMKVLTREGRFAFQRGGLYRIDRRDDTSSASVWRGDMSFQHDNFLLPIETGQAAEVWLDGPQRVPSSRWLPPLKDAFAAAVLQLDQAEQRSVSSRYVSAEMTGVEELDRYGRWEQHPDYGALWVPIVVSAGWAPYAHGHWAWVRPWGWTWVDDAPWGFAPFHYGSWLWWRGSWGWAPGPRVARPVFAPALVTWMGSGPRPVLVPGRGRHVTPGVGWVPLGPREAYRPGYRASPSYVDRINAGRSPGPGQGSGRGRQFDDSLGAGKRSTPGAVGAAAGREQGGSRLVRPIEAPMRVPGAAPLGSALPATAPADRKPFWPAATTPGQTNAFPGRRADGDGARGVPGGPDAQRGHRGRNDTDTDGRPG